MTDTWSMCSPMNGKRSNHSSCVLDKWIYVVCGQNQMGPINTIERLDARKIVSSGDDGRSGNVKWEQIRIGQSQYDGDDIMLSPRFNVMVAPIGSNEIVILGGYSCSGGYMGDGYILNIDCHVLEKVIQGADRWCIKF